MHGLQAVILKDDSDLKSFNKIILYDGFCILCSRFIFFIIRNDPDFNFKFTTLQSSLGQNLITNFDSNSHSLKSVVYIRNEKVFIKSTAVLFILRDLGGIWKFFYPLIYIPKIFRDFFYDIISKFRYRIFGKRNECMMPTKEIENRFI